MSQYLSRIEGPPPKRNVAGSTPVWDATNNAESLDLREARVMRKCLHFHMTTPAAVRNLFLTF